MGWFARKVAVTFINDATGEAFAVTKMSPDDIPETFEIETTLHIGDADWSVVHAEPRTRAEYSKSASLTLRLRRVEKVDLRDILFSLPSICDRLAELGTAALSGDEYVLAEDDWRQFELVSRQFADECDAEIAAIRRIHEQARAKVGWREIHVRRRPDPPICSALSLDDLSRAFGSVAVGGATYRGAGVPVASGYSFQGIDGLQCYGVADAGRVTVLGIGQDTVMPAPIRSADVLVEIARQFDLDLVHWCRCVRASWDDPLFRQLLVGDAHQ
jgi:hypothetical protein